MKIHAGHHPTHNSHSGRSTLSCLIDIGLSHGTDVDHWNLNRSNSLPI